jgi:hypothetical protein
MDCYPAGRVAKHEREVVIPAISRRLNANRANTFVECIETIFTQRKQLESQSDC